MPSYAKLMARAGHPLPPKASPVAAVKRQRIDRTIYARFYLPALPWDDDKAEIRTINLDHRQAVEWVDEMSKGYADLHACELTALTTFFPDHPTKSGVPGVNF